MKKLSFEEQIKDPSWQRKRLEILKRDEWMCQICFSDENQLQVHHKRYKKNTHYWDYDDSNFISLCCDCHSRVSSVGNDIKAALHFEPNLMLFEKVQKEISEHGWFDFYELVEIWAKNPNIKYKILTAVKKLSKNTGGKT